MSRGRGRRRGRSVPVGAVVVVTVIVVIVTVAAWWPPVMTTQVGAGVVTATAGAMTTWLVNHALRVKVRLYWRLGR
ncbi:hypothetical protein GCM10020229_84510 [Kitasatospora albolonga]